MNRMSLRKDTGAAATELGYIFTFLLGVLLLTMFSLWAYEIETPHETAGMKMQSKRTSTIWLLRSSGLMKPAEWAQSIMQNASNGA